MTIIELLKRERALYHDENQLIQSANEANEELAQILEEELGVTLPEPSLAPPEDAPPPAGAPAATP